MTTPNKSLTPAAAAQYLIDVQAAGQHFLDYVRFVNPRWSIPDFHKTLGEALDLLEKGLLRKDFHKTQDPVRVLASTAALPEDPTLVHNVLITMPPRHSKSTYGSVLFPAYYQGRDAERHTMSCSYNKQLASGFGGDVRELVWSPRHGQVFPSHKLSAEKASTEEWRTTEGGKSFFIGLGGTTSGRPANFLNLDDPIKAREEADSITYRNRTWSYYTSALRMRLEPDYQNRPPIHVMILTRWHPDDVAGRVQQLPEWTEDWLHITMPALSEEPTGRMISITTLPPEDPRHLTQSQIDEQEAAGIEVSTEVPETRPKALWPERFPVSELEKRRRLDKRGFAALFQQRPFIEGGNLIRSSWWRTYPSDFDPHNFPSVVIAADTSFKKGQENDPSVALVGGLDINGDIYLLDRRRAKLEFPELKRLLISMNTQWRGRGLKGIYIEDKASGQSVIQELKRESGLSVIPHKVVSDKVARLNAVLPLIEGGRVFLPASAHWVDEFVAECEAFPNAPHDDQVDALVILLDALSRMQTGGSYYIPPPLPNSYGAYGTSNPSSTSGYTSDFNPDTFNPLPPITGWGE